MWRLWACVFSPFVGSALKCAIYFAFIDLTGTNQLTQISMLRRQCLDIGPPEVQKNKHYDEVTLNTSPVCDAHMTLYPHEDIGMCSTYCPLYIKPISMPKQIVTVKHPYCFVLFSGIFFCFFLGGGARMYATVFFFNQRTVSKVEIIERKITLKNNLNNVDSMYSECQV